MRTQILLALLLAIGGAAAYIYTQTDLLEPEPGVENTESDAVARSRAMQEARAAKQAKTIANPHLATVPTERPMVGPEGVDVHGYPLARPDQIGLKALLRAERFDELTRYVTEFQEQAEKDFHHEVWPAWASDAFYDPDPSLTPLLGKWAQHSPDSFAPYLARGKHRVAQAWEARGAAFAQETGEDRLKVFGEQLLDSNRDLQHASKLRSKLVVGYSQMLSNATPLGVPLEDRERMLALAVERCPQCFLPHRSFMYGLQPRWGGSYEAMSKYVAKHGDLAEQNPKLAVLAGLEAFDRCRTQLGAKDLEGARKSCDEAVAAAPDNAFVELRADVARRQERLEDALADLDAVLEKTPQYRPALEQRYDLRWSLQRYEDAAQDLLVARQLSPTDDKLLARTQDMARWLLSQSRHDFDQGKYEEARGLLELGLAIDPENRKMQGALGQVRAKLGTGEVEARAEANPDDFEALRDRDHALAADNRYMEVVTMWDGYIERHPDDGRAYFERGGAHHNLGNEKVARADIERACDLDVEPACKLARRWGGGR